MSASVAGEGNLAVRPVAWCRDRAARIAKHLRFMHRRLDLYDVAAAVLFGVLVVLVVTTFRDYAISNDEEVQQHYGELIISYYTSGFADHELFHFRNLYLYGGLFDIIAVGFEKFILLDTYAVRHALCAFIGIGGIAATWATARAIGGSRAGLLAAAALALCGIWYGAMFNHTKDIPFASAMMGASYFLLLIGRELPRPRWQHVAMFGLLCGCALGIRVLGLFLLSYAGFVVAVHMPFGPRKMWRANIAFAVRSALQLAPAFVMAYVIMLAAWPWASLAPLNPLPPEIVATIGRLYAVEAQARQLGLDAAQRLARRQKDSGPVMAALKTRLVAIRQEIPPGGKLAQACDYALGQWSRLEVFLTDGTVEIDNNWCEGAMRPLALGRKNWLHLGSATAGPKVAAIASIVETCRRLDINLRAYLLDVLPKLGDWPINRVAELTPTAWQAAHKKVV